MTTKPTYEDLEQRVNDLEREFVAHQRIASLGDRETGIADRKRAEQELKEGEEKFRAITRSIKDAVVIVANDEKVIFWNPAAEEMFGFSSEVIVGRKLNEFVVPPKYLERHTSGFAAFREKGEGNAIGKTVELSGLRKNGEEFPLELSLSAIKLDGLWCAVGTIRDITDRKQTEKALRKAHDQLEVKVEERTSELTNLNNVLLDEINERKQVESNLRKLNNAIEQAGEIVFITDADGNFEYVNPAFEKITGFQFVDVIGQKPSILKSGRQDNRYYEQLWKTIKSGNVWKGKLVNKKKTGEFFTIEANISPIQDSKGQITHFVAIQSDITEEIMLQEQLMQTEKLSSVGTLASGMAHELNNPLTSVLGYSKLLLEKDNISPEIRRDLKIVSEQAVRCAHIVKGLLKFSRKHESINIAIDVNDVMAEVLEVCSYSLSVDNVRVKTKFERELPQTLGDPNQIQQVFLNIIINAHYAMATSNRDGILSIATKKKGARICIKIENNGDPIHPDQLSKIFDPFYTTKEAGEGTGLGLSISYGIIRDHGGTIRAENISVISPDSIGSEGVRFIIELPIKNDA